jgi:hypothetical protein
MAQLNIFNQAVVLTLRISRVWDEQLHKYVLRWSASWSCDKRPLAFHCFPKVWIFDVTSLSGLIMVSTNTGKRCHLLAGTER